jgi:hypothetical protein
VSTARYADLPDDVATLQAQLRLARAQNADLHRQLQRTTPAAPAASTADLVPVSQRAQEGFASLAQEHRHLKARLTKAEETFRRQEARYAELAAAYEVERHQRMRYEQSAEQRYQWWQDDHQKVLDLEDQLQKAGIAPRPNYQWAARGESLADVLRDLLKLAHPDRWAQGQPATELAHELTITIQTLRQREGRPA